MSCAAFKLRFGIIGTNFISDWLLEGAAEDSRFEVAAIYSRSQDTANAFAVKHNTKIIFHFLSPFLHNQRSRAVANTQIYTKIGIKIINPKIVAKFISKTFKYQCDTNIIKK